MQIEPYWWVPSVPVPRRFDVQFAHPIVLKFSLSPRWLCTYRCVRRQSKSTHQLTFRETIYTLFGIGVCFDQFDRIRLVEVPVGDLSVLACADYDRWIGDRLEWVDPYLGYTLIYLPFAGCGRWFASHSWGPITVGPYLLRRWPIVFRYHRVRLSWLYECVPWGGKPFLGSSSPRLWLRPQIPHYRKTSSLWKYREHKPLHINRMNLPPLCALSIYQINWPLSDLNIRIFPSYQPLSRISSL